MTSTYILPLADPTACLETVGGKGLSLARLAGSGFPVPGGFHITTDAYRQFISEHELQPRILAALQHVDLSQPLSLEAASDEIRALFEVKELPLDLAEGIAAAYAEFNHCPVAVRSSATAEDLPEASFAGQQETYLNIHETDAVLDAVKKCWASLWTARAIGYRIKNNIDHGAVALAVVVEEMVNAESAGILFTANPLTGRDEIVINAAWGLGESVVGGLVTPDTIVVEKSTSKVKKLDVAEKAVITVPEGSGTLEKLLTDNRRKAQVLKEPQITELVALAKRIETFYGSPQDIEWCRMNGSIYILQSRPITTLTETKDVSPVTWKLPKGAYAAMRNNIVELMPEPLSPLFATLGLSSINTSLQRLMSQSFAMQDILPADIIVVVNNYAYFNGSVSLKSIARMIFGMRKILKAMLTGAVERWTEIGYPHYKVVVSVWRAEDSHSFRAVELADGAAKLTESAIDAYGSLISGVIPGAWMSEAMFTKAYNALIRRRGDPLAPTFLLGYDSLPIQADKSLYRLAEWANGFSSLASWLIGAPTTALEAALAGAGVCPDGVDPAVWSEWLGRTHEHLQNFGHTLYDLDFAHPVPADNPAPVLETFRLYLRGEGVDPIARQQELEIRRVQAEQGVTSRLKGWKLRLFKQRLASAQKYAPLREDGLAEIGLAYPLIRGMLRELGRRFTEQKVIQEPDDIYWLTGDEVMLAASQVDTNQPVESMVEIIPERKTAHRAAGRLNPPMALPQMKVFGFDLMSLKAKRGRGGKGNTIKGVPASPGRVSGTARVLMGPEDFSRMKPGDVLVAPITTPAWTPLFAMASAIVTDVGGPLSHGSIVAREYGIPAVLGVGDATRRIQDGQVVIVDGSTGTVTMEGAETR